MGKTEIPRLRQEYLEARRQLKEASTRLKTMSDEISLTQGKLFSKIGELNKAEKAYKATLELGAQKHGVSLLRKIERLKMEEQNLHDILFTLEGSPRLVKSEAEVFKLGQLVEGKRRELSFSVKIKKTKKANHPRVGRR